MSDATKSRPQTEREVPPIVRGVLRSQGQPIGSQILEGVGPRFGCDFSRVRIHTGEQAAASAAAVNAKAFTVGDQIVFGGGSFQPGSSDGLRVLTHELTHVLQQAGQAANAASLRLGPSNQALEQEADENSKAGGPFQVHIGSLTESLLQRDALSVARFTPVPGLYVDRAENSVNIFGALELSGTAASASAAASIESLINSTWTATFPDGFAVNCKITVTFRGPGSKPGNAGQIYAEPMVRPSYTQRGDSIHLNSTEPDAYTWAPAHEFGHLIGLQDRYAESIMSKIKGRFGGSRSTTVMPGYGGNIMAESGGTLESKNVRDVAQENEPSQYWINDDDQVRDWVNGNSLSEIGKLSTSSKLRAIGTLMGGWISDDDVHAIVKICRSVTSKAEADRMRKGIDLSSMSSYSQRSAVRTALMSMP